MAPLTPPSDQQSCYSLPSLGYQAQESARSWSAPEISRSELGQSLTTGLPTPTTSESDLYKPRGHPSVSHSNLAAAVAVPLAMGTSLDGVHSASQSLTERRNPNLPSFALPPPPSLHFGHHLQKYPSSSVLETPQGTAATSVGNLLTPPANASGENPHGISSSSHHTGIPPYTPSYWSSGATPNSYHSALTPQAWHNRPMVSSDGMYSPSMNNLHRNNTTSPTGNEGAPGPAYSLNSLSSYGHSAGPPSHSNNYSSGGMTSSIPASTPQSAPTSAMYQSSHTSGSHSQSYGAYAQSHHNASIPAPRVSSPLNQSPNGMSAPNHFQRPPYPSYSMPGMPGPIMSNLQNPGGPMAMVGHSMSGPVYNSGYAANTQQMYGPPGQHAGPPPVNDRPFKCNQCTQSFNRNHDLKRHTKIHLAVKPFPCGHCEKSFSRKDALKVRSPH